MSRSELWWGWWCSKLMLAWTDTYVSDESIMMLLGLDSKASTVFLTKATLIFTQCWITDSCVNCLTILKLFAKAPVGSHSHVICCIIFVINFNLKHTYWNFITNVWSMIQMACFQATCHVLATFSAWFQLVNCSLSHHHCSLSNYTKMLKQSSKKLDTELPTRTQPWCYSLTTAEPAKQQIVLCGVVL